MTQSIPMRIYTKVLPLLAISLLAIGCGEDDTATTTSPIVPANTSCGRPSGVPGEIVITQVPMRCSDAAGIAQEYFGSGKAPGLWLSAGQAASKGWQCVGHFPGKRSVIAQCFSYSTAPSAQSKLAQGFEVRPQG
jgi:hypothetical protein